MTTSQSPEFLTTLAINKLLDSLQESVARLDSYITSEITKGPPTGINSKGKQTKGSGNPATKPQPSTRAALETITIRKYVLDNITPGFEPLLLKHAIARAVETRSIPLIRLVLCNTVEILDFRALDVLLERYGNPYSKVGSSESSKILPKIDYEICTSSFLPLVIHCLPPDEFDWFSRDRLGKIISMQEASEIFSIVGTSNCASTIKEFYINAKRSTFEVGSKNIMEIAVATLSKMPKLTTLVLRGMADDNILKLVGKTATGLKRLDVSGSQFVTDEGIQRLFLGEIKENPATYLIPSWLNKNLEHMHPLVKTLDTLDYSWTSVSYMSRKMVQLLPGSYMYKRVFTQADNDAYGHHIFIRRKPEYMSKICTKSDTEGEHFKNQLQKLLGYQAAKTFTKFAEQHPWANSLFTLHFEHEDYHRTAELQLKQTSYGIITPNNEERRIHGVVNFFDGNLTELYTVYSVNLNLLGDTCTKLKVFRGIVTDEWKSKASFIPTLTSLDIFAEPKTIRSIFECCPNLKKVRIRVVRLVLTDEYIMKPIISSMCRRTLEELWIGPGSYKVGNASEEASAATMIQDLFYVGSNPPRKSVKVETKIPEPLDRIHVLTPEPKDCAIQLSTVANDGCPIEDLVNLTSKCIRTLIIFCKNLRRLGDIAWWTPVLQEELQEIIEEQKVYKSNIRFVWENHLVP